MYMTRRQDVELKNREKDDGELEVRSHHQDKIEESDLIPHYKLHT